MRVIFNFKIILKNLILKLFFLIKYKYRFKKASFIHPCSNIGFNVKIGKGTRINGICFISNETMIGNYCAIAHNFRVRHRNHSINYPNIQDYLQNKLGISSLTVFKGKIEVGDGSWIGDNVTFLPGAGIGKGCVVGAGSVVTKKFDDFSVIAGNPAVLIRTRFDKKGQHEFLKSKWWEWDVEKIKKNAEFFNTTLN